MSATTDKGLMTITAALLPDEIRRTLTALTMEYLPADDAEAWYTKITNIDNGSKDLITANMFVTNPAAGGGGTYGSSRGASGAAVYNTVTVASDKVKFLFIQHLSLQSDGTTGNTADSIYLTFDGGTVVGETTTDNFEIGPGESWYCKPNCVVADINAICALKAHAGTSSSTIQCVVAAIIEDVA